MAALAKLNEHGIRHNGTSSDMPLHEIDRIDDDHHEIFKICSNMQCLSNQNLDDSFVLQSYANILLETIGGHFHRETLAMKMACYPRLSEHIKHHNFLYEKILNIISSSSETKDFSKLLAVPKITTDWFRNHIVDFDNDYVRYVRSHMVDSRSLILMSIEFEGGAANSIGCV
jgi:hemerythrin